MWLGVGGPNMTYPLFVTKAIKLFSMASKIVPKLRVMVELLTVLFGEILMEDFLVAFAAHLQHS
jgi:hypothetical protein